MVATGYQSVKREKGIKFEKKYRWKQLQKKNTREILFIAKTGLEG